MNTNEFIQTATEYEDELLLQFDTARGQPLTLSFIMPENLSGYVGITRFAEAKKIDFVEIIHGAERHIQFPEIFSVAELRERVKQSELEVLEEQAFERATHAVLHTARLNGRTYKQFMQDLGKRDIPMKEGDFVDGGDYWSWPPFAQCDRCDLSDAIEVMASAILGFHKEHSVEK